MPVSSEYNTSGDILVDGNPIEYVEEFCYLGSIIQHNSSCDADIGKANSVFARLNRIWKDRKLSLQIKMRLYESLILPTLLYSAETWNMTVVNRKKLEAAHHKWLRKILRISCVDRVTNEEVRWRTGQESLKTIIRRRRLRWFGHMHRMSTSRLAHQALDWTPPEFRKKPGRPGRSWKSTIKEDLTLLGLTWDEAKEEVEDREEWRCRVARCATRARGRTKV